MTYGALSSTELVIRRALQEAVDAATREIARAADRARGVLQPRRRPWPGCERFEEAATDYERALSLDPAPAASIPRSSTTSSSSCCAPGASRKDDPAGARHLERYRAILPEGRHVDDIEKWADHFKGVETVWYRDRA